MKKIKKNTDLFNINKYRNNDFLNVHIKIFLNENNMLNGYYENNPDKLPIVSTLFINDLIMDKNNSPFHSGGN